MLHQKQDTMENLTEIQENLAYRKASRRVKTIKNFYGSLTAYALIIPFIAVVNYLSSPSYWWFYWPMLGWGLGLSIHAIQIFVLGENWEEKKIQELLDKDYKKFKSN